VCGPELSDLEAAVRQQYSDLDVTVFGLTAGQDSTLDLQAFLDAFQMTFPILLNAGNTYGAYHQSGGTSPYPLDYVIDQEGRVAYFSTEYDPEAMIAVIDGLLGHTSSQPDIPRSRLQIQAAPNPFNPQTEILFVLNREQPVSLDILDARGSRIRTLLSSELRNEGQNRVSWNGRDNHGRELSSGLYLARIRTLEQTAVTKLTLVR